MQFIFLSFAKRCSDSWRGYRSRELVFLVILLSIISCITCDDVHVFPVFMCVICLWENSTSSVIPVDCSNKATLGRKTPDTVISHSFLSGENKSALNAKAHCCSRNCKQYFYVSHFVILCDCADQHLQSIPSLYYFIKLCHNFVFIEIWALYCETTWWWFL